MVSRALQLMKGVTSMTLSRSVLVFQGAGGHDGRHRAPEAQQHGDEGLARQAQLAHDPLHHIGHPGHIAAVLQQGQAEEQDQDVGQEGDDGAHAGDDAVHHQGGEHVPGVEAASAASAPSESQPISSSRVALEPVPDGEGEEEDDRHDAQEDGDAPHPCWSAAGRPAP